jgi:hypothetical protein
MISRSDRPDSGNRIFRIALALSLLVHLIVGFLVYETSADVRRALARVVHHPKPQPSDIIVSLSSAMRIEKRARPAPQPHSVRVARRSPQRPAPRVVPHPLAVPVAVVHPVRAAKPKAEPPARSRHELAKVTPHARPQAAKTTRSPAPEKVVAALQEPESLTRPEPPERPVHAARAGHAAHLSEAQLEQIQRDLAKTIVADRAENNPLSNVQKPVTVAAATRRYHIDFAALAGNMREAQGLCDPTRSWQKDGWDYYMATCTIEEPDGTSARKAMPWPVRWRPRNDPWNGLNGTLATGPMPLPPPGWRPDGPVDPDFIPYLRKNGYPI